MHFIDEQNDILRPLHLVDDIAHAFFKLAAVLRPGDNACQIQREQPLAPQRLRDPPRRNILRHALNNGSLADTRFADERGVVLVLAREDLQHGFDLALPSDHGPGAVGLLDQVRAELLQQSYVLHRLLPPNALSFV